MLIDSTQTIPTSLHWLERRIGHDYYRVLKVTERVIIVVDSSWVQGTNGDWSTVEFIACGPDGLFNHNIGFSYASTVMKRVPSLRQYANRTDPEKYKGLANRKLSSYKKRLQRNVDRAFEQYVEKTKLLATM